MLRSSEEEVEAVTTRSISEEKDRGNEEEDPDHSCYWSEWSEWSKCGLDLIKQRTRFCVGLKGIGVMVFTFFTCFNVLLAIVGLKFFILD